NPASVASRSIPQDSPTAKTGYLGTVGPVQIVERLAALLPFLSNGDSDTRAASARTTGWEFVRISLPTLRNVDRLQNRQRLGGYIYYCVSTHVVAIRAFPPDRAWHRTFR